VGHVASPKGKEQYRAPSSAPFFEDTDLAVDEGPVRFVEDADDLALDEHGVRNVHVAAQAGRRNLSDRRLAVAGRAKDEDGLARVDRAPRTSAGTDARPVRSPQPLLVDYDSNVAAGSRDRSWAVVARVGVGDQPSVNVAVVPS
jgi:hypothetical protein